jgi:hypothetical protein
VRVALGTAQRVDEGYFFDVFFSAAAR